MKWEILRNENDIFEWPDLCPKSDAFATKLFHGTSDQWNLAPLPAAEESHLLETEVALPAFETFDSAAGDLLDGQFLHDLTSQELAQTAYVPDGGGGAENLEEERVTIPEQVAEAEPAASNSQVGIL